MSHQQHRPTVIEIAPLVASFYEFEGNGCGGSLHIVLDDGNIEDSHVDYCISYAQGLPETRHERDRYDLPFDYKGELLGRLLRMMSLTQRGKLYARKHEHTGAMSEAEFVSVCRALLAKYQTGSSIQAGSEASGIVGQERVAQETKSIESRTSDTVEQIDGLIRSTPKPTALSEHDHALLVGLIRDRVRPVLRDALLSAVHQEAQQPHEKPKDTEDQNRLHRAEGRPDERTTGDRTVEG
jgi:hypothetical protein